MKNQNDVWYGLVIGAACIIIGVAAWFFMSNASIDASIKLPPGVPRSNVLAFWPADGNAVDIVGGHDCVLENGARFSDGIAGRAFELDNTAGINGGRSSRVFPSLRNNAQSPCLHDLCERRGGGF